MNSENIQFQMETDREMIPNGAPSSRVLKLRLTAPAAEQSSRARLNLALVLDRSGSMSGEKLTYVKQAAKYVVEMLQETDSVSVVVFDDKVDVLAPSARLTAPARAAILQQIAEISTGGSTNLSGGWLEGCRQAASAADEGSINRTLLLTDGEANAGIVDPQQLAGHALELFHRGVSTSTFGVGQGFNEHLLEAMSNQGGGNFYFIEHPDSIPVLFQREFKELAAITAKNVEIVLNFPAHWYLKIPGSWQTQFTEGCLRISLGSMFSAQSQEIFIWMSIPATGNNFMMALNARVSGKGQNEQVFENQAQIVFQTGDPAMVATSPQNLAVLNAYAPVYLAEVATEALKLERRGERDRAGYLLMKALSEFGSYMSRDENTRFRSMAERMQRGMDEMDRKQSHFDNYNQKRGKQ